MGKLRMLAAAGALVLAACSSTPAAQEVRVEATEFAFGPATIEVTAGLPVTLTLANVGSVEHDLTVQEIPLAERSAAEGPMEGHTMSAEAEQAQLHVAAPAGQPAELTFTPTQPGTYEFACSVPGHKEAGMIGTLVVRP